MKAQDQLLQCIRVPLQYRRYGKCFSHRMLQLLIDLAAQLNNKSLLLQWLKTGSLTLKIDVLITKKNFAKCPYKNEGVKKSDLF